MALTVAGRCVSTTMPVREADGLGNVVRDEQGRLVLAADDLRDVARHGQPASGSPARKTARRAAAHPAMSPRADECAALAHPARELVWQLARKAVEPVLREQGAHGVAPRGCVLVPDLQPERHVAPDRAQSKS